MIDLVSITAVDVFSFKMRQDGLVQNVTTLSFMSNMGTPQVRFELWSHTVRCSFYDYAKPYEDDVPDIEHIFGALPNF